MEKKYTLKKEGALYRIYAAKDSFYSKKGEKGGRVAGPQNLSQSGECWIEYGAQVMDNAYVGENAHIRGAATVRGEARVTGQARVAGRATVKGKARVMHSAVVCGSALVVGRIGGRSYISEGYIGIF